MNAAPRGTGRNRVANPDALALAEGGAGASPRGWLRSLPLGERTAPVPTSGDELGELVGESPAISAIRAQVTRLLQHQRSAGRMPPVLVLGETGTGKGLLARAIHRASIRASGPFVTVNCAAIPDTLLEAELFGFERGAFTDARQAKPGLFQSANGGTLFLDEIGALSVPLQAKLLTVLEDRAIRRLGSTRSDPLDVWIVAASSEDLATATRERRFREDLYHRLCGMAIPLPPLRDRGPDIIALAERFVSRFCAEYGVAPKRLAPEARAALDAHAWPGNVRELANLMERVTVLVDGASITRADLGLRAPSRPASPAHPLAGVDGARRGTAGPVERAQLLAAFESAGRNLSRAAALLGVPRNTLRYRLETDGWPATRAGRPAPSMPRAIGPSDAGRPTPPSSSAALRVVEDRTEGAPVPVSPSPADQAAAVATAKRVSEQIPAAPDVVSDSAAPLEADRRGRQYDVAVPGHAPPLAPALLRPRSIIPNLSLAVLPLVNLSGDPAQEHLGDGIAEDITGALARCRWLFLVSRVSTLVYKSRCADIRQIARELDVRYVVTGTVRTLGPELRVTAELVDAVGGNTIWAERYDEALADVFDGQDRITTHIAAAVERALRMAEAERARPGPPGSLDT